MLNFFKLKNIPIQIKLEVISRNLVDFPIIVLLRKEHYVVVFEGTHKSVTVSDPLCGISKLTIKEFLRLWATNRSSGVAILIGINMK